ncbi:MAG: glycosyltransferase family 2 protein [Anaerolineae bacterium]|nr:glycosyltransferase family 2 protein [Anaerolineae bacterium]
MDISILIVSWNVRELLRRCLVSVASSQYSVFSVQNSLNTEHCPLNTEIIVVDNASSDGTVEMLRAEFPHVRVIANTDNVGFTRANNQALALAQGRYLFLLNPDTELHPNALQTLYDYAEAHPDVGIIGPRLFYGDGTPQSSRRRFPTLATAFLESTKLQQWFPRNRVLTRYYILDTRDDETQEVDWVTGAAMFVRRAVYEQIGGLDEGFFMYSEELDWCYRAKRAGWRIVYLPTAQVIHHEGKSSEQVLAARDIHFHSSKVRFFRKHHGTFVAEILRAFLLAMFAYQIVEESLKWLLGHKRALRAARVKAYWQVLQSGLKEYHNGRSFR